MGIRLTIAFALALIGSALNSSAETLQQFSGFASLGLVSNSNDDLLFRRDITQSTGSSGNDIKWRNDTNLGLQWQAEWSPEWQTTAQVIFKDRPKNNEEEVLEWAFVRYRPNDSLDIRAGRMAADIFLVSNYRQVGYALQSVRPPEDTYALLSFFHFDGIDFNQRFDLADGTLSLKGFYGQSDQEYPTSANSKDLFELEFSGGGLSLSWEKDEWKMRYSYANVTINNENETALITALEIATPLWADAKPLREGLSIQTKSFNYNQISVAYDNNTWWAQSEITQLVSSAQVLHSTDQFYLTVGRRFDQFSLYATSGFVHTIDPPISLIAPSIYSPEINEQLASLAYATERTYNSSRANQHSVGIGVRWDFTRKMALKAQIEDFKIDKNGSALWIEKNNTNPPKAQNARVISVSMDVMF